MGEGARWLRLGVNAGFTRDQVNHGPASLHLVDPGCNWTDRFFAIPPKIYCYYPLRAVRVEAHMAIRALGCTKSAPWFRPCPAKMFAMTAISSQETDHYGGNESQDITALRSPASYSLALRILAVSPGDPRRNHLRGLPSEEPHTCIATLPRCTPNP